MDELAVKVDAERLAQEIVLLAQKADVREELDRLMIHVGQARDLIDGPGPHGRRLDFLTQELNREANTLGAKSSARKRRWPQSNSKSSSSKFVNRCKT